MTYWLAGQPAVNEREFSSVSGFRLTPAIAVQTISRVRAAAVEVLDRKNLQTTISFGTTRKFATAVGAELWSLDYDASHPRSGTLIFESPQPGGGVSRRYMAGAVVQPPTRAVTGVSVDLSYTVTGGLIKSSPPVGEPA